GVTEWGLYVEINENKCEGMVPIRDLDDDYYEFDEKSYCLTGRRNHKFFRLGDPIRIQVARANLERKQLDFALATDMIVDKEGKAPLKVLKEFVPKSDFNKKTSYSGDRSKSYSKQKSRKR
ncbi:MAG TPA: S1 RNA-binding domain-containing protein, partial [Bacteroidales bacterium]